MKVKAEKSTVSQKEVLQWRKDFLRLTEIVHNTKPTDFRDAQRKMKKLNQMFHTFLGSTQSQRSRDTGSGVQQWLDFHVLQTPARGLVDSGGLKSKFLQPLLDKFELEALNALPTRPGWYVERHYKDPTLRDKGIDLFRLGDGIESDAFKRAVEYVDAQPDIKDVLAEEFRSIDFTSATKAATKFFDAVRDFIGVMGEGDKKGAKEITRQGAIHPEYKAFNMTFVNKAMLSVDTFDTVVQKLSPFLNRLKKFIPEIIYGGVILLPEDGPNFALKDGSGDSKAAAQYESNDTVVVFCKDYHKFPSSFGTLMVHELGHRYYRKKMDASDRARWVDFTKKGSPASKYGSTDPEEDFCESLAAYIGEKVGVSLPTDYQFFLSKDVFDRLEAIVGRRLTASTGSTTMKLSAMKMGQRVSVTCQAKKSGEQFADIPFAEYAKPNSPFVKEFKKATKSKFANTGIIDAFNSKVSYAKMVKAIKDAVNFHRKAADTGSALHHGALMQSWKLLGALYSSHPESSANK